MVLDFVIKSVKHLYFGCETWEMWGEWQGHVLGRGDMPWGGLAPSRDFTKGADGDWDECRVGDHAHPCAISPKTAIRGRFSLGVGLLPK